LYFRVQLLDALPGLQGQFENVLNVWRAAIRMLCTRAAFFLRWHPASLRFGDRIEQLPKISFPYSGIRFDLLRARRPEARSGPMSKPIRRDNPAFYPMPVRLDCPATLRVSDDSGRLVRREDLPAGANLAERLRDAHETYARLGWEVSALRPGARGFAASRNDLHLLIAIRAGMLVTAAATASAATAH
jgi:hypothetical protein